MRTKPNRFHIFILSLFLAFLTLPTKPAHATTTCETEYLLNIQAPEIFNRKTDGNQIQITVTDPYHKLNPHSNYRILLEATLDFNDLKSESSPINPSHTFSIQPPTGLIISTITYAITLQNTTTGTQICQSQHKIKVISKAQSSTPQCNITINPNPTDVITNINIKITNLPPNKSFAIYKKGINTPVQLATRLTTLTSNSAGEINYTTLSPFSKPGTYDLIVSKPINLTPSFTPPIYCSTTLQIYENLPPKSTNNSTQNLCQSSSDHNKCLQCLSQNKLYTALGCIPFQKDAFIQSFLRFAIGIAGGIALLLMLLGSTLILTGGSNPEQVKKGKEIFSSALMGLLFIIFSAAMLKIIWGDMLQIPGTTTSSSPTPAKTILDIRKQQGGSL